MAGRSMPGRRPRMIRLAATMAPVEPAETTACTSPALWSFMARTMGLSGRLRMAEAGDSPISMSWVQGTTRMPRPPVSRGARAAAMASGSPYSARSKGESAARAATAPGTTTCGP